MTPTQTVHVAGRGAPAAEADFCYLKDQDNLSPAAYERAVRLREQVAALVEGRSAFLEPSGRDPAIHQPRGNWELGGGLYAAYRTVLRGDYHVLNHLRLFSQIFTGYQLLAMARSGSLPIPTEVPADADERLAERAPFPDYGVEGYLETVRYLPELLHLSPPHALGEVGWLRDGRIVNHDSFVYLERMVLLAEGGKLWELRGRGRRGPRPRILEIGPGYGGLAYHVKRLIPEARYYCLDIPESLLFSSLYLTTLFEGEENALVTPDRLDRLGADGPGFTFLPNYLFDDCVAAGQPFDLVINTLSMSEMVEAQVRYYCDGVARLLAPEGVFFEQNQDNLPVGFLDARQTIGACLPFCLPLSSPVRPLTQGRAHLWATHRFRPYPWLDSAAYLAPPVSTPRPLRLGERVLRRLGLC